MGTVNEFKSVYRTNGLRPAVKWVGRDLATSVFHPATYLLVDLSSPFLINQDGLEERFRANGSIEYYDRKRSFEIELPPGDDHVKTFRERPGTYTIDQPFVGELQDVLLVGSSPVPVSNDKKVILEAIGNPEVLTLNIVATLREQVAGSTTKPTRDPDPIDSAVLLYNQWNQGYYHWTVETLTRLEGVETYCERTGEVPKLIVGPDPNRFQLQTLELLGYDQDDLITWDDRARRVNNLIVPSMRRDLNPGTVSPIAYQWLRDRMRTAVASEAPRTATDFSKRVYISREDAPRRQVVNEDEVLERLDRYGFEKYVLSEHSVAENIALFVQAETIVAPHGAGLTDMIYADDVTVIELFRSNDVRPSYFVLSEMLDHRYRYVLCESDGPNLVVDPDRLEKRVTSELELDSASERHDTDPGKP